jgi:hypothetical protein
MPSHGAEIIEGVPVLLKDGVMYAFQYGIANPPTIKLGTYVATTKKATWDPVVLPQWLASYRMNLVARSRKI